MRNQTLKYIKINFQTHCSQNNNLDLNAFDRDKVVTTKVAAVPFSIG